MLNNSDGQMLEQVSWWCELLWLKYTAGCSLVQGQNLIQAKLPVLSSGKRGTGGHSESPVHAFVMLERYNAIKAIQFIHASLAALSKVLRGTQLLTSAVQTVGSALINLEVTGYCLSPYTLLVYFRCLILIG